MVLYRTLGVLCVIGITLANIFYDSILLKIAGAVVYTSFFEWTLHRFLMHKTPKIGAWKFDYAFHAHTRVHHKVLGYDHTYHLPEGKNKMIIAMAWWNCPVLIFAAASPFILGSLLFGISWYAPLIVGLVALTYYGAYESFHWCMHLPRVPRRKLIERSWVFFRLNGHHLLHHRYMHKNFNVILPLPDLCLGTLRLRAVTFFTQARSESLPDVQPQ